MYHNETALNSNTVFKLYFRVKSTYLYAHNGTTFHYICSCKITIQQSETNYYELQN
jgi:hypothetical protein